MVKRRRMHIRDVEGSGVAVGDARCGEHVLSRLLLGEKSPARMRSQLPITSRKTLQSLALAEVTILVTATALMSAHMHLQALRRKNSNTGHQNSEVDLRVSRRLLHMHSWQLHMMLSAKRSQTETIITIAEREI